MADAITRRRSKAGQWLSGKYTLVSGVIPIIVAACIFGQVTAWGCNNNFGIALAASMNLGLCLLVSLIVEVGRGQSRKGGITPLVLIAIAVTWAIAPEMLSVTLGLELGRDISAQRNLPDMLIPNLFRVWGAMAAVYIGYMIGQQRGTLRPCVNWLLIFGFANLLFGLIVRQYDPTQYLGEPVYSGGHRYSGTVLNPNTAGTIAGVIALLAWGRSLELVARIRVKPDDRARTHFALSTLGMLSGVSVCMITGSRTAIMLTLLAMLLLAYPVGKAMGRGFVISGLTIGFVLIGFFALDPVLALLGDTGFVRLKSLDPDSQMRLDMWGHYWELTQQAPWFGYGLFSFSDTNLQALHTAQDMVEFWYVNAAHNIILEMLLEGGWPYFLLSAAALLFVINPIYARWKREAYSPLVASAMAALVLILGVSLVDIALTVPAVVTLAGVILGLLWGRASRGGVIIASRRS